MIQQSRARKGAVEGSQRVGAAIGALTARDTARLDRTLAGAALFRTLFSESVVGTLINAREKRVAAGKSIQRDRQIPFAGQTEVTTESPCTPSPD